MRLAKPQTNFILFMQNAFITRFTLLAILLLTFLSFQPSLYNGFVNWDDPDYLLNNPTVRSLNVNNIQQIFTSFVTGNYQPLTILSFAYEYTIAGYNPFLYHFDNLILHLINTGLVFILVRQISQHSLTGLITALLFGIHPMRVESVAWITERKDVLFVFFYLLTLISYIRWQLKHNNFPYITMLLFILSCLAKPAAVSLPLVLLLLDHYRGKIKPADILSKIPFFLISLTFSIIAIAATYSPFDNPFPDGPTYFWWERFILAGQAMAGYLGKFFWPVSLSAFYPYPSTQGLPENYYLNALLIFLCVILIFLNRNRSRLIFFGSFFFLSTIALNLPFLSVGHTLMADRFTYLPYLGLFLIVAEGIRTHFIQPRKRLYYILTTFILVSIIYSLAQLTFERCRVWKNGLTLWSDVLQQFPNVALAYQNRADWYFENQRIHDALSDYTEAIRSNPHFFIAYNNRGNMHLLLGQNAAALRDYNRALELNPKHLSAYLNRAQCYILQNDFVNAARDYDTALRLSPDNPTAVDGKKMVIEKLNQKQ